VKWNEACKSEVVNIEASGLNNQLVACRCSVKVYEENWHGITSHFNDHIKVVEPTIVVPVVVPVVPPPEPEVVIAIELEPYQKNDLWILLLVIIPMIIWIVLIPLVLLCLEYGDW